MRRSIAFALVLVAAPAGADVLWRGDFESGDKSQWSHAQEVSEDRMTVVDSPVRQGSYALRVEVRQGDDPIDSSGNRAELVWTEPEVEGNERWYAWSTLWADDYPSEDTWQLFTQWHHSGNSGSPPLEIYVVGEEMRLRVNAETVVWTAPLARGVWRDFVLHVLWSPDPEVGFVELWLDGELALPLTNVRNMYEGQDNYLKQGLYRNETIEEIGVLFHDGMTVGTTRDDVVPPAAEPDPPPPDAGAPLEDAGAPGDGTDAGSAPADAGVATRDAATADGEGSQAHGLVGGCSVVEGEHAGAPAIAVTLLAVACLGIWGSRGARDRGRARQGS